MNLRWHFSPSLLPSLVPEENVPIQVELRSLKTLIPTSKNNQPASSFLDPLPNSLGKGRCTLYVGYLTLSNGSTCITGPASTLEPWWQLATLHVLSIVLYCTSTQHSMPVSVQQDLPVQQIALTEWKLPPRLAIGKCTLEYHCLTCWCQQLYYSWISHIGFLAAKPKP